MEHNVILSKELCCVGATLILKMHSSNNFSTLEVGSTLSYNEFKAKFYLAELITVHSQTNVYISVYVSQYQKS